MNGIAWTYWIEYEHALVPDGHPARAEAWLNGISALPKPVYDEWVGIMVLAGFPLLDGHDPVPTPVYQPAARSNDARITTSDVTPSSACPG